jgi:hypothetical protein
MKVQGTRRGRAVSASIAIAAMLIATSCTQLMSDTTILSADQLGGRQNNTPGSAAAQTWLIDRLTDLSAVGLDSSKAGDDAFRQPFTLGTNILGLIPGTDKANEYVMIGAHYDHQGSSCRTAVPSDTICNGATDNATGTAAVLAIAKMIKDNGPPRRSVILALWDREEDGLLGSKYYTEHPIVPIADTVAYLNFDIQGATLLPSLQNHSFAVGAETGGAAFETQVQTAIAGGPLQTKLVSSIFGQGRSDYINFTAVGVPNVFFSDSTGPCYHTAQDDITRVDFWKLDQQVKIGYRLAAGVIAAPTRPTFSGTNPLATFNDAIALQGVVNGAIVDIARFTPAQQTQLLSFRDTLNAVVTDGAANFGSDDVNALILGAVSAVSTLTSGVCDGFIPAR